MRISDWSLDVCSSDLRWPERWAFQRHVFDVGALQTKAGVSSFGGLVLFGHGVSCNGERVRASGLQNWDEAACAVQCGQLVIAADVRVIDVDLRDEIGSAHV